MKYLMKIKDAVLLTLVIGPAFFCSTMVFRILKVIGLIEVARPENIPAHPRHLLVVSNHPRKIEAWATLSLFSHDCLFRPWRIPWSTPKMEFAKWVNRLGLGQRIIPFKRKRSRHDVIATRTVVEKIESGQAAIYFPEGTRTLFDQEDPFKPFREAEFKAGLERIVRGAECKVLAICVEIKPAKLLWVIACSKVIFHIGKPFESKPSDYDIKGSAEAIIKAAILDARNQS